MRATTRTNPTAVHTRARWLLPALAVLLVHAAAGGATAQEAKTPRPRVVSMSPMGTRSYLTKNGGAIRFGLNNPTDQDIDATLMTYYDGAYTRQDGRTVWVPARATLWSWYQLGPLTIPTERERAELKSTLTVRSGGKELPVAYPNDQPFYSNLVRLYRPEAGTTVMLDAAIADASQGPLTPRQQAQTEAVRDLVRLFRLGRSFSDRVDSVGPRYLPPTVESFDGVDHFVLASNRLAEDVAGQRVLREWVARGGHLWVMLDMVESETLAALLGDALPFQVVDRLSLSTVRLRNGPDNPNPTPDEVVRDVDEPVDFVRVLVAREREGGAPVGMRPMVLHTVDGWPASFVLDVGRGKIVVTTLAAPGWYRPRTPADRPSPVQGFPNLPVALAPLDVLANYLHPPRERPAFTTDDLRAFVTEQVGYSVIGRGTVLVVLGSLFLGLAVGALLLGRRGVLEHLGWLGPVLAVGAAVTLVAVGEQARRAVPPTLALAEVVDAVPGAEEVQVEGVFAAYQPESVAGPVGVTEGGSFSPDLSGLEGSMLRRVRTDLDRWHWEKMELPAGMRLAPFQFTARTKEPVTASARFGPDGLEGRVHAGPFGQVEDALVSTPGQRNLALRIDSDGTFRAGSGELLPPGQFLAGSLVSDRQLARHRVYEKFLGTPQPSYLASANVLLGWADPIDPHFTLPGQPRITGAALLTIPLQFDRTPPDTRVLIPSPFLEARRVDDLDRRYRIVPEGLAAANVRIRYQLPPTVLPLAVERVRWTVQLNAPGREVVLGGFAGKEPVAVRRLQSPLGVERVEFDDPALLQPDKDGGLYLNLVINDPPDQGRPAAPGAPVQSPRWYLEAMDLEVTGRTRAK